MNNSSKLENRVCEKISLFPPKYWSPVFVNTSRVSGGKAHIFSDNINNSIFEFRRVIQINVSEIKLQYLYFKLVCDKHSIFRRNIRNLQKSHFYTFAVRKNLTSRGKIFSWTRNKKYKCSVGKIEFLSH